MATRIEIGRTTGGRITRAAIRSALKSVGIKTLQVGFFKSSRYRDGTYVAAVAAWNEFGTRRGGKVQVPERPFFRSALKSIVPKVREIIEDEIDPKSMTPNDDLADKIGAYAAAQVQNSIVRFRDPPNAPATIARKGSSNPLIDIGKMRQSVTWRSRVAK